MFKLNTDFYFSFLRKCLFVALMDHQGVTFYARFVISMKFYWTFMFLMPDLWSASNSSQFSFLNHLYSSYGSNITILATRGQGKFVCQICDQHAILPNFHVWTISVAVMDQKLQFWPRMSPDTACIMWQGGAVAGGYLVVITGPCMSPDMHGAVSSRNYRASDESWHCMHWNLILIWQERVACYKVPMKTKFQFSCLSFWQLLRHPTVQ